MSIWKDILGYEKLYKVSNTGKIESAGRLVEVEVKHRYKYDRIVGHVELQPRPNKKGYLRVCLSKNKKKKDLYVHRLVAEAFIPNPENLPEVNHKDGDKTNNNDWNLEWTTHKNNQQHASETKLIASGEKKSNYTLEEVTKMREMYSEVKSYSKVAKFFNGNYFTIRAIIKKINWKNS